MSDRARLFLTQGIAAAKANDLDEAYRYLEWVLITDSTHTQQVRAYEYLAQITTDAVKKRDYLEELFLLEPGNALARREMAKLKGELQSDDTIDATHLATSEKKSQEGGSLISEARYGDENDAQRVKSRQFVCRQCGGEMTFEPRQQAVICHYCELEISMYQAVQEGAVVTEKDFAVALATAKGHHQPQDTQTFNCQGCGAGFVLGPQVLSLTCPYCHSAHVIESTSRRSIIPPKGIIPFSLSAIEAKQAFYDWLKQHKLFEECQVAKPQGVYLPVWTFDVAGTILIRSQVVSGGRRSFSPPRRTTGDQQESVFYDDIPVLASHHLPSRLADVLQDFDLRKTVNYDPHFLVDFPADTYGIAPANASLVARKLAWRDAKQKAETRMGYSGNFLTGDDQINYTFSSAGLYIDTFKLILVPVWLMKYRHKSQIYNAVVSGQQGQVHGERPDNALKRWFKKII